MMTTQVRERTGFGFMFDTIRIPMPIIRPVAIPRPAEMTTTMPVAPMAAMPMMMMPMGGMGGMAGGGGGGGSLSLSGSMDLRMLLSLLANQGLSPQQLNMFLQLAMSGQLSPQVIAALQAALAGTATGGTGTPAATGTPPTGTSGPGAALPVPAPSSGAPTTAALQEQLRLAEQKLKLLEELQGRQQQTMGRVGP